jgi:uroporphyrinogen-III decarboxylase
MSDMTSKDRVLAVLDGKIPDRVPTLTFGIDTKIVKALGGRSVTNAFDELGLDVYPIFCQNWCQGVPLSAGLSRDIPEDQATSGGTFAGWDGIDEFGRIWKRGSYVDGAVKTTEDIERYVPELILDRRMNPGKTKDALEKRADKSFAFVSHTGPFGLTLESIGFEDFFYFYMDNRDFVKKLLWRRTEWFAEIAARGVELGADFVLMGDDVAFKGRTYIAPADFEELVVPCYRHIVKRSGAPVIWHSDGFITPLLDAAIKAGLAGVHSLEPKAGVDMGQVKREYGHKLILVGNVDCGEALTQTDLGFVRREVERCMHEAKARGRYILSDSNSIHGGCNLEAVKEMYRYTREIGGYEN